MTRWPAASRCPGRHVVRCRRWVACSGSGSEADDAVQEAWLRLSRCDSDEIKNLGGWLTTVVGRVCLNMLQSRKTRREEFEPVTDVEGLEQEAALGDSIGLSLPLAIRFRYRLVKVVLGQYDSAGVPGSAAYDRASAGPRGNCERAQRVNSKYSRVARSCRS
ncbi:sigma factor [Nocardia sp. NPDC050630]|uniref:sigma factor n=1 Tax=Nocardia sp. NPDC050630 TaxID=3364321 RepID=UPI003795B6C6